MAKLDKDSAYIFTHSFIDVSVPFPLVRILLLFIFLFFFSVREKQKKIASFETLWFEL